MSTSREFSRAFKLSALSRIAEGENVSALSRELNVRRKLLYEWHDEGVFDMAEKAVFYHAGCPVCVDAERRFAEALDAGKYNIEVVHLGEHKGRIGDAEKAGVKSVPAIVIDRAAYHINHGADLSALR